MARTKPQLILVAVLVCLFAVGMAGFLNYFKYRSNAERIIRERLVVTASSVENSIQSSMALGLQFTEIGTLPETMERERATDDIILSIDVFDTEGKPMYSTDRLRAARFVPQEWTTAARQAAGEDWSVRNGTESAAGIAIKNSFGLVIGYVALRYSEDQVNQSTMRVARDLALMALGIFVVSAAVASLLLVAVMNGLARDFAAVEAALRSRDSTSRPAAAAFKGPFGRALRRFFETTRHAEAEIAHLRSELERGSVAASPASRSAPLEAQQAKIGRQPVVEGRP